MKYVQRIAVLALMSLAGISMAGPRAGTPRRVFHERIYFIHSVDYYSPVWYAGDGYIATRKVPGAPLWPAGHFNEED